MDFKRRKISNFSKVFVKKLSLFPSFVLMQLEQETPIAEVSEQKEALFDYEKRRF